MLSLNIKDLDFKRTRSKVLKYIHEYNYLLALQPVRDEPQITQAFSFIPPATNKALNSVEQSASRNIKRQQLMDKRERVLETMHSAIDKLPWDEKYIVVENMLNKNTAVEVYIDLNMSKTKFHEVKQDAIVRLAFYLGIEVYEGDAL